MKTIIEDNPDVDPTALPIGYELMIRKSEIGDTPAHKVDSQWNDYKETLNRTAPLDSTASPYPFSRARRYTRWRGDSP